MRPKLRTLLCPGTGAPHCRLRPPFPLQAHGHVSRIRKNKLLHLDPNDLNAPISERQLRDVARERLDQFPFPVAAQLDDCLMQRRVIHRPGEVVRRGRLSPDKYYKDLIDDETTLRQFFRIVGVTPSDEESS